MLINKKILQLILCTSIIANPIIAKQKQDEENYDSGKDKVIAIITNEEAGIPSSRKNTNYAETLNLNDLNLSEIAEFFDCKTLIGKHFFTETLNLPICSQDTIISKQNIIRALVENPDLKKEIDQLLNTAKEEELEVIKLMSEFFIGQNCPELKNLELIKQQNPSLYPIFKFLYMNPTGKYIGTGINLLSLAGTSLYAGYTGMVTYKLAMAGFNFTFPAFYTSYLGLVSCLSAYSLHKEYKTGSEKRSKLYSLNQMINIAERIEDLCNNFNIKNQFRISDIKDSDSIELIQKLKHKRYKSKKSKFFNFPSAHSLLYSVYQNQKHLAVVLSCIAEMDAYNAIASKILESQGEKNKLCFVEFLDNKHPIIKTSEFWNLLVKDAVTNNLNENKNIILTGPNAGGKTTAIKAILQNIILGQSFGIAAASVFEFTIFDVINSYLNVSDDILNGLSLFASEVKRAQEILQKTKSLDSNKKFFFALDELFTGTAAEDGEDCAYKFIKKILEFKGIQFIYATHFKRLTELGNKNTVCINYKVNPPIKEADGQLCYPFTLSEGINQSKTALDIAKNAKLFE